MNRYVRLRGLLGDEPVVFFRTVREVERTVRRVPFGGLEAGPSVKLYVAFSSRRPERRPRLPLVSRAEGLEAVALKNLETFIVSRRKKNGFFGFPNTFIEKELGVTPTSRNWSTLHRIVELARWKPVV